MKNTLITTIKTFLNGALMGLVETIPGVSGSTIALVMGIYKRFIASLKSINISFFKLIFSGKIRQAYEYIDGGFFFTLLFGMVFGIIFSLFTISFLLTNNPQELWAFFFGLILASGFYLLFQNFVFSKKEKKREQKKEKQKYSSIKPKKEEREVAQRSNQSFISNADLFSSQKKENVAKKPSKKSILKKVNSRKNRSPSSTHKNILYILLGLSSFAITISFILMNPLELSQTSLFVVFISGILAISAFLLPGISGSFVLLLLGMYSVIIPALKSSLANQDKDSLVIMAIFAAGALTGVVALSRVLHSIFSRFEKYVLAFLVGVIFASLIKVWPWKIPERILTETGDILNILDQEVSLENITHYTVISEKNYLPNLTWDTGYIILFILLGALSLLVVSLLSPKK